MDIEEFGDLASIFGVKQRGDISRGIGYAKDHIAQKIESGNQKLIAIERQRNADESRERATRRKSRQALVTLKRGLESLESENNFDQFFQTAFISFHLCRIEESEALESIDDFAALDNLKHSVVTSLDEDNFPDIQSITTTALAHATDIKDLIGEIEKFVKHKRFFDPGFESRYRDDVQRIKQARESARYNELNSFHAQCLMDYNNRYLKRNDADTIKEAKKHDLYKSELRRILIETDREFLEMLDSVNVSAHLEDLDKQQLFFGQINVFDENLNLGTKASDLITKLECELWIIDGRASDLIKSQNYLPQSFKAFMDAAGIEFEFDDDDVGLYLNFLQQGEIYEAIVSRINDIQKFVEKNTFLYISLEVIRNAAMNLDFEKAFAQLSNLETAVPGILDYNQIYDQLSEANKSASGIKYIFNQYKDLRPNLKDRIFKDKIREKINFYDSKLKTYIDNYPIPQHQETLQKMVTELKVACSKNLKGFDQLETLAP